VAIKCPTCGETNARHLVARADYDPIAPQLVGGVVMTIVFALSRKRRFRCDRCRELFHSHTVASRLWLALWVCFCASLALVIAAALLKAATL
jgi:ribosomal protein L32